MAIDLRVSSPCILQKSYARLRLAEKASLPSAAGVYGGSWSRFSSVSANWFVLGPYRGRLVVLQKHIRADLKSRIVALG